MTATNKCYNFVGFGYRAPLRKKEVCRMFQTQKYIHIILLREEVVLNFETSKDQHVEKCV